MGGHGGTAVQVPVALQTAATECPPYRFGGLAVWRFCRSVVLPFGGSVVRWFRRFVSFVLCSLFFVLGWFGGSVVRWLEPGTVFAYILTLREGNQHTTREGIGP